jgi:hypothetical protein
MKKPNTIDHIASGPDGSVYATDEFGNLWLGHWVLRDDCNKFEWMQLHTGGS